MEGEVVHVTGQGSRSIWLLIGPLKRSYFDGQACGEAIVPSINGQHQYSNLAVSRSSALESRSD